MTITAASATRTKFFFFQAVRRIAKQARAAGVVGDVSGVQRRERDLRHTRSMGILVLLGIYHGYVPGIRSLQVTRDGIPQFVGTVPLCTGTAVVHVLLFCIFLFLPWRGVFVAFFTITA